MKRYLKRHPWWTIGAVAALLIGASVVYAYYAAQAANQGVTFSPHVLHPRAEVTLVEYSDFACPACEETYPTVTSILQKYGDQLSFEYRYFPLIGVHQNSVPAATAAEAAAQQGKFFEMYAQLFENASQWANAQDPQPYFLQYAQTIGLNMDQYRRQLGSTKIHSHILQAYQDARAKNLTSTPTFYLNGQKLTLSNPAQLETDVAAAVAAASGRATSTASTTPGNSSNVQFKL